MKEAKAVNERFINGRMRIVSSGADKEWADAEEEMANTNATAPRERSDGSTASYYELPENATELQDLISHRNMNGQIAEVFRECYRYGLASHSDEMRGIKKILFYAKAELERLQKMEKTK